MTPKSTSTEQLLVRVLLRSAVEVLRLAPAQSAGGPERAAAYQALQLAFAPLWARLDLLELACTRDALTWSGQRVLGPDEDDVGLAPLLANAGIHSVTLLPGVEEVEIRRLMASLDEKLRLDPGDDLDLVMMLFRGDFHFFRYGVSAEGAGGAKPTGLTLSRQPAVTTPRADASADGGRGVIELEKFDSTLYFLDQREVEYLTEGIRDEYGQDHSANVLRMLLDILELHPEPETRTEAIAVLHALLPHFLGTGRFEEIAYLSAELRRITREGTFDAAHADALGRIRVSVSDTRALHQLFHALEAGQVRPTVESLDALLSELRPEALQMILIWSGQLSDAEVRSEWQQAIEGFFKRWPLALARMIVSADRTVVHRALVVAAKLRSEATVDALGTAARSDDAPIRRLAVQALAAIGTAAGMQIVARLVSDPDQDVRTVVYQALTARPYRGAEKALLAAVQDRAADERELGERRALFSAYGASAGAGGIAVLGALLEGRMGLGRKVRADTRACAAVALGVIDSPLSRAALTKASTDRDPVVRSAARAALRRA